MQLQAGSHRPNAQAPIYCFPLRRSVRAQVLGCRLNAGFIAALSILNTPMIVGRASVGFQIAVIALQGRLARFRIGV
jgi:hypothetical protein